jgi:hypothetical protein
MVMILIRMRASPGERDSPVCLVNVMSIHGHHREPSSSISSQ